MQNSCIINRYIFTTKLEKPSKETVENYNFIITLQKIKTNNEIVLINFEKMEDSYELNRLNKKLKNLVLFFKKTLNK